jgi:hypothetical protein
MEFLGLGLVVLAVYFFIRLLANVGAAVKGTRFRAYRQLASRYGGRYETRGASDTPTVSFAYNGSAVRVGLAPTIPGQPDQFPRTRVVCRFPAGIPFRLELAPQSRPDPPQPPKGTRPVAIGEPTFDAVFHVQANDPEMARDFLIANVREAINHLARLGPPGGMLLAINPERMLVQVDRNLGTQPEAFLFAVQEALVIHDGLMEGVDRRVKQGIAIVHEVDINYDDEPTVCKVCNEPIDAGPVLTCAVCRTPHHRDCWEYVGGCSIYGCNGKVGVAR